MDSSFKDVVFVLEDTALNGAYISELRNDYILPILEEMRGHFPADWPSTDIRSGNSYTLIPFPGESSFELISPYGPYSSPSSFLSAFDAVEYVGGSGEYSCGVEGIAAGIQILDNLTELRKSTGVNSSKYMIYIANSQPYDSMVVMDTPKYSGQSLESLLNVIKERNIRFSLLSPRKIPFLFRMFKSAVSSENISSSVKDKNFAKDPRHLILLNGIPLCEVPLKSTSTMRPSNTPSFPLSNNNNNAALVSSTTNNNINNNNDGLRTQQPVRLQQQQQQQRMPNWQLQHSSDILRNRLKQQQQAQVQQQSDSSSSNSSSNPTLKGILSHPSPRLLQPNSMSPLLQQLARPSSLNQQGVGVGLGQSVPPPQQQQQLRQREMIWEGELQWKENMKIDPGQDKVTHMVVCSVTTSKGEDGNLEVAPTNWPKKLIMQLIPKTLVQTIGGHYFKNARSVLFHPEQCESLGALTRVLGTGYAGCVHFTGVAHCDIKVLILLYSSDKRAYLGFIPNDQVQFVDRIRKVIQQQKTEQQAVRSGQPGPSLPGTSGMQQQQSLAQTQGLTQSVSSGLPLGGQGLVMNSLGPSISANQNSLHTSGSTSSSAPMGSIERIQSLEQELQRQKDFYRQQQIVQPNQQQQQQQQQQQLLMQPRMVNQGNLRQVLQPSGFTQRGMTLPQQSSSRMVSSVNQPTQNDSMLRDLLN